MGRVERLIVQALIRRIDAGATFVTAEELHEAVRSIGVTRGEALAHSIDRLIRRNILSTQWDGVKAIGYRPTAKAYAELQPPKPQA